MGNGEEPAKKKRIASCPTCLGLFSEDFQHKLLNEMRAMNQIQEYECKNIVLALSMPINVQIRQLSMWFALLQKFGTSSFSLEKCPDAAIKEILKLIIYPIICKELGRPYDTEGLIINIALNYDDNGQEFNQLKKFHAKAFPITKGRKEASVPNVVSRGVMEKYYTPQSLKAQLYEEYFPIPPTPSTLDMLTIAKIDTIGPTTFIAGRYQKLSRKLSHTPWILKGKRIMEESIEEIIIQSIAPHFR